MNIKRVIRQIEKEQLESEVIRTLVLSLQERYEVENKQNSNYWGVIKTIEYILDCDTDKMTDTEKVNSVKTLVKELTACS